MNTNKTLAESVNEVLKSRISAKAKAAMLVKIGVTPYEANILAKSSLPTPSPRRIFEYTFGVEMETIHCDGQAFMRAAANNGLAVINHLFSYSGCHTDVPQFKLAPDGSIRGYDAAECVTPALKGDAEGFNSLKACCNALKQVGATVNMSCGLHVHIGAADLTDEEYCNVFVNYMRLEQAINSFLARSRRAADSRWCKSLTRREFSILHATTKSEMRNALCCDRYHRVNAEAYSRHSTIEFRQHQGTVSYSKIQHWVEFLAKLVEFSKTNRLNDNIDRIEDIPFLTQQEKNYFIRRRAALGA